ADPARRARQGGRLQGEGSGGAGPRGPRRAGAPGEGDFHVRNHPTDPTAMNLRKKVEDGLAQSAFVKLLLLQRQAEMIEKIGVRLAKVLKAKRGIFIFGNGGSAADSQHIAAELESRFMKERRALPCLA